MNKPAAPHTRFKPALLVAGLLLYPCSAGADMVAAAVGHGYIHSQGAIAVFFSYQKDAPVLFKHQGFYEFTIANWTGPNDNTALTVGRALHWNFSPENYFSGTLGIGVVNRTTEHLGTIGELVLRLAFGHKFGKYDLSIGHTHYSNGKTALGLNWEGPNVGEDFLTLRLAREL